MAERARERESERERERERGVGPPITLKQALGGSQSRWRSRMVSMEMTLE